MRNRANPIISLVPLGNGYGTSVNVNNKIPYPEIIKETMSISLNSSLLDIKTPFYHHVLSLPLEYACIDNYIY